MTSAPTQDQIRAAAEAAAALTGEAPEFLLSRFVDARARLVAFAALAEVFPEASVREIATALAFFEPEQASALLARSRKASWWKEGWVDDVVGALVADIYGEQAE